MSWAKNQGCLNDQSTRVRLTNGEDGTFAGCYEACETGGYKCCRMNFNWDTPRCHASLEDVEIYTEDKNHWSTLVCSGKCFYYSFFKTDTVICRYNNMYNN